MENLVIERIRSIIKSRNESPRSFAMNIQFEYSTLNNYLTGRRKTIDSALLAKILSTYGDISAEWLLLGQGSMYKSENTTQEPSRAEERIDTKSTLNVLIKTIEYYQKEVDRIMDNINELRKENEILKIELERKKAVGE